MTPPKIAPYGSWKSPITADLIVSESIRLGMIVLDGADTYWTEGRPVRPRLRGGLRVPTCLRCGNVRRVRLHRRLMESRSEPSDRIPASPQEPTVADEPEERGEAAEGEEE